MILREDELRVLIEHNAGDPNRQAVWIGELAYQRIAEIQRQLPNPTGLCSCGREVYIDQKGVYSSGYVFHSDDNSLSHCGETWDPDTPEVAALKREWANLKHIANHA